MEKQTAHQKDTEVRSSEEGPRDGIPGRERLLLCSDPIIPLPSRWQLDLEGPGFTADSRAPSCQLPPSSPVLLIAPESGSHTPCLMLCSILAALVNMQSASPSHKFSLYTHSQKVFFKKIFYLLIFRERGREGEREGEKHECERETSIGCLSYAARPGTKSATTNVT